MINNIEKKNVSIYPEIKKLSLEKGRKKRRNIRNRKGFSPERWKDIINIRNTKGISPKR